MSTDKLIGNLCNELEPVKKCCHPSMCLALWAVISLAYIGGMIWLMGLRHDFDARLMDPAFLFEVSLITLLGAASVACTFWLRVPDMRGAKWMLPVPFTLIAVYGLWMGIRAFTFNIDMPEMKFHHCMKEGALIVMFPAVFMFFTVFKGCTTRPVLMSFMNAFGIASVGYLALRLTCASENIGHVFYAHLMPLIIVGTFVGFLARRLYKW
ncbi:NrsF family protein [Alphaproteobacteria bacterium]|nr:NrsF family protein [Alphaproteobacteria bacterium]